MIKASIVIPTLDKLSRLKACLKALEPQINDEIQVVVVFDGCSKKVIDDFHAIQFAYEPTVVICEKNVGRAAARNRGIAAAKGKIIIFMDDDRIPGAGFVEAHVKAHENRKCAVFGRRFEIKLSDNQIEDIYVHPEYLELAKRQAIDENIRRIFKLTPHMIFRWMRFYTGNVSVDKDLLEKVNGFDENYVKWGNEDVDLGLRLQFKRVPYYYVSGAENYHMLHASNYINKAEESIESMYYMRKKFRRHPIVYLIMSVMIYDLRKRGTPKVYAEDVKDFHQKSA